MIKSLLQKLAITGMVASVTLLASANEEVQLPDIGDSSGQLVSPQEMRAYGINTLRQIRASGFLLEDPQVQEYLDSMAFRLVAHSDRPDLDYHFFVINEGSVNAFAAPGGYIGVHSGLILQATRESEVAAVLAHEIAHVSQRHLARAFESAQKMSVPMALIMLGAIIASQVAGSGDAAQAAMIGGSGLMQQAQINFTRSNEYEADRVGIDTLYEAGFYPPSMADFFATMGRLSRNYGEGPPEFLRTHPVSTTRIAEAKGRAEGLQPRQVYENPQFLFMRERIRVLTAEDHHRLLGFYNRSLEVDHSLDPDAARYGLALTLTEVAQPERAIDLLTDLTKRWPDRVAFSLALAKAHMEAEQTEQAMAIYRQLNEHRPLSVTITWEYAEALMSFGDEQSAIEAEALLRPVVERNSGQAMLVSTYAQAADRAGISVRAGEAIAHVHLLNGRLHEAVQQLRLLARRPDLNYYQRERIDARLAEIEPYLPQNREDRRGRRG
ncbi:MAG: putative beta-barrel assembly-enhancing protease [Lysobacteraceae bacterium]|nr:MAG: putative beta-barrel assembly-enhancing protease [Xanthomonadaceae bacterium]